MDFKRIAKLAVEKKMSDIFIVVGLPIKGKARGAILGFSELNENSEDVYDKKMLPDDTKKLIEQIYELAGHRNFELINNKGDDDFSFAIQNVSRFRVNAYRQRGTFAAVIRMIDFGIPDAGSLGIEDVVAKISNLSSGMALVTGPAGSGKSTTLACAVNEINQTKESHIITLEDPIEFLHSHKNSIVTQREINIDTENFVSALRAALRQAPNAILIGELRDSETIEIAMTAAETGHLILSSLHTIGAAKSIDRIVDSFPPNQQAQILLQLSMVLKVVVSQQLIPTKNGQLTPVFEVVVVTPAIANLIREGKTHQINNAIATAAPEEGMISVDKSLTDLYNRGDVDEEILLRYANNKEMIKKRLNI